MVINNKSKFNRYKITELRLTKMKMASFALITSIALMTQCHAMDTSKPKKSSALEQLRMRVATGGSRESVSMTSQASCVAPGVDLGLNSQLFSDQNTSEISKTMSPASALAAPALVRRERSKPPVFEGPIKTAEEGLQRIAEERSFYQRQYELESLEVDKAYHLNSQVCQANDQLIREIEELKRQNQILSSRLIQQEKGAEVKLFQVQQEIAKEKRKSEEAERSAEAARQNSEEMKVRLKEQMAGHYEVAQDLKVYKTGFTLLRDIGRREFIASAKAVLDRNGYGTQYNKNGDIRYFVALFFQFFPEIATKSPWPLTLDFLLRE